jgi:YhcG PDDEXK nuclease domain
MSARALRTNFGRTLQDGDAEVVQRITRDPVVLDFVQLADGARERDLEVALLEDIERFMLALSEGFYFAGRQKSLQVGREKLILDLLFFHHPTRRFVVIDLKLGPFKAEFAGKMNLYVNAVDTLIAHEEDRATVGFILCAGRDEAVAHLTLQGIATLLAVTRYTVGEHGVQMAGEDAQVTEGSSRRSKVCAALSSRSPSTPPAEPASWLTAPSRATASRLRRPPGSIPCVPRG